VAAVALGTWPGRRILAASIVGSGAVFLEGTVVNVALPAIARDLGLGLEGVQWVVNAYLLALGALTLLGGALGDRYGRRRLFGIGSIAFAIATAGCALAPSALLLLVLRFVQGAAGAMLVPNSLAMLEASFDAEERGTAIGRWAGWSAVSTAIGPLVGGSLVDAASWRWVFAVIAPVAIAAAILALGGDAPEERGTGKGSTHVDYVGAVLIVVGLGALTAGLIDGPKRGFGDPLILGLVIAGVALLVAFAVFEHRTKRPLLPPELFHSTAFSGANAATVLIYAGLSGLILLLVLQLQGNLKYSALESGAALLPTNALMLLLSPLAGRVAHRFGARAPMAIGAVVAGVGMVLFSRVVPGASYVKTILPAVIVFGLGLSSLVAPLTSAVLAAAPDDQAGTASGVNNAAARLAGLMSAAALPAAAGLGGLEQLAGLQLTQGFARAMWICAGLCWIAAIITWLTVGSERAAVGS
jgi:EmrB/QacA subfamily drug resistance transporter